MAKFNVTPSELTSAANMISEDNAQFRARVSDLITCAEELSSMWQGDANVTFTNYFNTNSGNWTSFAALIDEYVAALNNVATIYNNAESVNTETARTNG
jgi:WXG100 family type VII secretion target